MIKKCKVINSVKIRGQRLKGQVISVEIPEAKDDYIIIGIIEQDGIEIRFPLLPADIELLPEWQSN